MTVEYDREADRRFTGQEKERILEIASQAERDVRILLPDLDTNLFLEVATGKQVIPETGDGGTSLTPTRIRWTVDPEYPGGLGELIGTRLRKTVFHELHHLARGWTLETAPQIYERFLDGALSEGLATVFAREFAGDDAPWGRYGENVTDWAREVVALPPDAPYEAWMFQLPDGGRWVGYFVGTYLVDRAIEASGKNAAELVHATSSELMAMVGEI